MKVIQFSEFINEGFIQFKSGNEYVIAYIKDGGDIFIQFLPKSTNDGDKEKAYNEVIEYIGNVEPSFLKIFERYTKNDEWVGVVLKLDVFALTATLRNEK